MRPCRRCGYTNPRRMIALMSLWFGHYAGQRPEPGYFYLCPACYQNCIAPHASDIMHRLTESHPVRRGTVPRTTSDTEAEAEGG
jgi:hypothetical protein